MILQAEFSRPLVSGAWRLLPESHGKTALVACPKCQQILAVGRPQGQKVSKTGHVRPAVDCTCCHTELDITLNGWRTVRGIVREVYLAYLAKVQ